MMLSSIINSQPIIPEKGVLKVKSDVSIPDVQKLSEKNLEDIINLAVA